MDRHSKDSLFQHLDALQRLLRDWEEYARRFSLGDITRRRESFHLACHAMLRAIQETLDIAGGLVVVLEVHPRPETYKGTVEALGKSRSWPTGLTSSLVELAGFRNVLVHQYEKLDLKRVHRHLRKSHKTLRKFQKLALGLVK